MISRHSFLTLLLLAGFELASARTISRRQENNAPGCGFEGNGDVYGIGIRIGLYTQWLSTLLTNWLLVNRSASHIRDVNTCFQLAMLIALLSLHRGETNPHAVDVYLIILQILGSTCTISSHATTKSQWKSTSWGGLVRFGIYWAVAGYSTYYWFYALKNAEFQRANGVGCVDYGFLFAKVQLEKSWFRWVHAGISVVALIMFTVLFGFLIWKHGGEFLDQSVVGQYRAKKQAKLGEAEGLLEEMTNGKPSATTHKYGPALCVVVLVLAVVAIEATVLFNGITGINDPFNTGQLIPLVTGVGGLVRTIYKLWKNADDERVHLVHKEKRVAQQQRGQHMPLNTAQHTGYPPAQYHPHAVVHSQKPFATTGGRR